VENTLGLYRAKLRSHLWKDYVKHNLQVTPVVNPYHWLDNYPKTRCGPHHLWFNSEGIATMTNPNQSCKSPTQTDPPPPDNEYLKNIHEVHLPIPSPLPPIHKVELSSKIQQPLSTPLHFLIKLNLTPSTLIQNLGPRKIMSLVLETPIGSHISVPLVNMKKETQIQQGDVLFKENFRRLRIVSPDVFHSSPSRGSNTPLK
jgi:hypothetical protein